MTQPKWGGRGAALLEPFRFDGALSRAVIAAFVAVNLVVAVNALIHDRRVGYDAEHHINYLTIVGGGALPGIADSAEFFVAPLPYVIPASLRLIGISRPALIEKAAQAQNVLYSLLLTYFLIRLCKRVRPDDWQFAWWVLVLVGLMPVYARTMAMIRGEPLAAALGVMACELYLAAWAKPSRRAFLITGACLGFAMLAKQWAAFVVCAVAVDLLLRMWINRGQARRCLVSGGLIAALLLPIGGPYYLYLHERFGTAFAFTHPPESFSLANRPQMFYWGGGDGLLFTTPVRGALPAPERFWPVLYSDTFGDYWFYFLVSGRHFDGVAMGDALEQSPVSSNLAEMMPALARANIAGTLPAALFIAGLLIGVAAIVNVLRGRPGSADREALVLCTLAAILTFGGYVFMLIWTPALDVKASYLLQFYPFAALLAATALRTLQERSRIAGLVTQAALIAALACLIPLLFSRYSILGGFDGIPRNFT